MFRRFRIRADERGLLFREGVLVAVLQPGTYWRFDPLYRLQLTRSTARKVWLEHELVDVIAKSGKLGSEARVIDLADHERALVWIDGRFDRVLGKGVYIAWSVDRDVRVEVIDIRSVALDRRDLATILATASGASHLMPVVVETGRLGLVWVDGVLHAQLGAGRYAFWRAAGVVRYHEADLREQVLDLAGQDIITADKVTLRINAVLTWKVVDPVRSVTATSDVSQTLYRSAQLALREVVGTSELDALLANKDGAAAHIATAASTRADELGVKVISLGIRDIILPGDMKEMLNKVTEAKKAAEASLITRREETAAMRMQANTAKLLESNPTLMRLRELEVLEKIAGSADLTVMLGEGGLADRVMKLL